MPSLLKQVNQSRFLVICFPTFDISVSVGFLQYGAAVFRSAFFDATLANALPPADLALANALGLRSLIHTLRESKIFPTRVRTKSILRPELVLEAGIHFPWRMSPKVNYLQVDPEHGLVHHYRYNKNGVSWVKGSSTLLHLARNLTASVQKTWRQINLGQK